MSLREEPGWPSHALGTEVFAGEGEMAHQMRSTNWAETALGATETWPETLRSALRICLESRFPMEIWWGPEYFRFCNDAFQPFLSAPKYAQFLGCPGRECWPESWTVIGPLLEEVRATGKASWFENFPLTLNRNGVEEQCYFTFSYSPIRKESGEVGGVFCACLDVTRRNDINQLLRERARLSALGADIGFALTQGQSLQEMLGMCTDVIVKRLDCAFARIWTANLKEQVLELQASSGMYTHLNGPHSRVPIGKYKIGAIAATREPHLTNDVVHDPAVSNQDWAHREKLIAFAGYPLIIDNRLVGVVALFSRHQLGPEVLQALETIANSIALGIERKQNDAALRQGEVRKAAILNTALDCFITVDQESRILEFNPAAEATFGYRREQVIGKPMPELIMPPEFRQAHWQGVKHYLQTGEAKILGKRLELEAIDFTGRKFPIELAVTRIPVEGAALFTATIRDITTRKEAEQELLRAKRTQKRQTKPKASSWPA